MEELRERECRVFELTEAFLGEGKVVHRPGFIAVSNPSLADREFPPLIISAEECRIDVYSSASVDDALELATLYEGEQGGNNWTIKRKYLDYSDRG